VGSDYAAQYRNVTQLVELKFQANLLLPENTQQERKQEQFCSSVLLLAGAEMWNHDACLVKHIDSNIVLSFEGIASIRAHKQYI